MTLTIGFAGRSGAWRGVLRDESGAVVAECGHSHPNRDGASSYKSAAIPCMKQIVKAARLPPYRKFCAKPITDRADELTDVLGSAPVQCYGQQVVAALPPCPRCGGEGYGSNGGIAHMHDIDCPGI
ncbi:hypothetical protein PJM47_26255 [Mycobacterium kansasii]